MTSESKESPIIDFVGKNWPSRFPSPLERQFRELVFRQSKGLLRLNLLIELIVIVTLQCIALIQNNIVSSSPQVLLGLFLTSCYCLSIFSLTYSKQGARFFDWILAPGLVLNTLFLMCMAQPFSSEWIRTSFGAILLLIIVPLTTRIRLFPFAIVQFLIGISWSIFLYLKDVYPTVTGRPIAAGSLFLLPSSSQ